MLDLIFSDYRLFFMAALVMDVAIFAALIGLEKLIKRLVKGLNHE